MASYSYTRTPRVEPGEHRVTIVAVEEKVSSKGSNMIVVTLQVNGTTEKINHYIVYNEYFNRNMTQFFDSFNIAEGDFDLMTWPGAIGAAKIKEDDQGYPKVAWFIRKDKAEALPAWVGAMPERQTVDASGFAQVEDDELPF